MTREEIEQVRRAVRHALYGCLLSVLAALLIGVGNVAYTNHVDQKRFAVARQQERDRATVGEQTRQLVCQLALAQADAFREAESEPGRKSLAAWQALATRFNCT